MSLESNNDLVPLSAYRDMPADNQPVAWYPVQKRARRYTPSTSHTLSLFNEPGTKRYIPFSPPIYSNREFQPELPESAYNSGRCFETPKMNQVGLLIDIYA